MFGMYVYADIDMICHIRLDADFESTLDTLSRTAFGDYNACVGEYSACVGVCSARV